MVSFQLCAIRAAFWSTRILGIDKPHFYATVPISTSFQSV